MFIQTLLALLHTITVNIPHADYFVLKSAVKKPPKKLEKLATLSWQFSCWYETSDTFSNI